MYKLAEGTVPEEFNLQQECYKSLTPRTGILPEKLIFAQLVKNLPAFYLTLRFLTAFTSASHLFISCVRSVQFKPHHIF